MNHSPTTPNHKGHDKDTNSQVSFTQLVDIQVSIRNYNYYAQGAAGIVKNKKSLISHYENLKTLNVHQERARADADKVVNTFLGIMKCVRDMIDHLERNNAGRWQEFQTSAAQSAEFVEIMQEKFATKCQETNGLKKEIEELKKENEELKELLHKCIIEFAA